MSDSERPRPQYGEYASKDEQAQALALSGADPELIEAASSARVNSLASPLLSKPAQSKSAQSKPDQSKLTRQTVADAYSARAVTDRLVTVFLLSFWAVFIVSGAGNFVNLGDSLHDTMKKLDYGDYHATGLTAALGIAMLATQIVLWIIAAVWSYRRLSRKKSAWWVPVVLGVLSFIVLTILLGTLLAADPSFVPHVSSF